jgi:hypothetical protein
MVVVANRFNLTWDTVVPYGRRLAIDEGMTHHKSVYCTVASQQAACLSRVACAIHRPSLPCNVRPSWIGHWTEEFNEVKHERLKSWDYSGFEPGNSTPWICGTLSKTVPRERIIRLHEEVGQIGCLRVYSTPYLLPFNGKLCRPVKVPTKKIMSCMLEASHHLRLGGISSRG